MQGVSIIICTHNGVSRMKKTLDHILRLSADFPWELIIVDNASTDGTTKFCTGVLTNASTAINWRIVDEPKAGLIYARLCGLKESKYEIVLYCDDDNGLSYDYLQVGFEVMNSNRQIGALGGCGIAFIETEKPEWFDRYSHSFAVGPQATSDGRISGLAPEVYGAGTFLRKRPLLLFFDKGFKTIMSGRTGKNLMAGDDVEWCYLIQLAGYEIWYDHRLTFIHDIPEGRLQWPYYLRLKQGITYGTGRLLPYLCLLKDRNMGHFAYSLHWLMPAIKSTLVFIKHKLKSLIAKGSQSREDELAFTILQARMNSYWQNIGIAFDHFKQIKSVL